MILIITFAILYASTGFVSFFHSIQFFNIANPVWLSVMLSGVAEIGQSTVLFSILLTKNKNKFLSWFIMIILTSLQVIGNVVGSFKWIETSNTKDFLYFQQSILFWVEGVDPMTFKVIISWICGALLPVIALSLTALVSQNIQLRDQEKAEALKETQEPKEEIKEDKLLENTILKKESEISKQPFVDVLKEASVSMQEAFAEQDQDELIEKEIAKEELAKEHKLVSLVEAVKESKEFEPLEDIYHSEEKEQEPELEERYFATDEDEAPGDRIIDATLVPEKEIIEKFATKFTKQSQELKDITDEEYLDVAELVEQKPNDVTPIETPAEEYIELQKLIKEVTKKKSRSKTKKKRKPKQKIKVTEPKISKVKTLEELNLPKEISKGESLMAEIDKPLEEPQIALETSKKDVGVIDVKIKPKNKTIVDIDKFGIPSPSNRRNFDKI
jgi:hypothetical protein